MTDAANFVGCNPSSVSKACNGSSVYDCEFEYAHSCEFEYAHSCDIYGSYMGLIETRLRILRQVKDIQVARL